MVIMKRMVMMMMPEYIPPTPTVHQFSPNWRLLGQICILSGIWSELLYLQAGFCLRMMRMWSVCMSEDEEEDDWSSLMREMKKMKELCWAFAQLSDEDDVCVFLDDEHDQGSGLSPCVCKQCPAWGQQWQHWIEIYRWEIASIAPLVPLLAFITALFVPESPVYLVGRLF